jgi:MFS family permease
MHAEVDEPPTSVWSPLEHSVFRALWIASLVSNIGTWMQNVGGVWLMSSFSASPFLVALMQTSTSLPVFLVGLPAGALADIVDRRRLLLGHGHDALAAAFQRSPSPALSARSTSS